MFDRIEVGCVLAAALVAGIGQDVSAQQQPSRAPRALTEADVVRLAAEAEPGIRVAQARVGEAQAGVTAAALWDNPTLGWQREALPGVGGGQSEDAFALAMPLDLSGRRAARGALSRSDVEVARAGVRLERSRAVAAALQAYYVAVAAREEAAIARRAVQRLEGAARVVAVRHREGSVSGHDRLRLDIEAELSRSRALRAEAGGRSAVGTLCALLGLASDEVTLQGGLDPDPAVTLDADAVKERPSERQLRASLSALADAQSGADRAWIPRLRLRAGLRVVDEGSTEVGYVAGVGVELPLLSYGQELSGAAQARRAVVAERIAAGSWSMRVRGRQAALRLAAARGEVTRLTQALAGRLDQLEDGALASYREGVRSLTELLDAQRTRTQVEQVLLQLRLQAKQAEVALRDARGELQ